MSAPPLANPLRALLPLVAEDPGLIAVAGRSDAVLAVPEVARAVTVAAVAETAERRPLLVVVPTTPEAERLEADLAALLGRDRVEGFPAWETLPFERVSPSIDTSGQRLEVLWRLGDPATMPWVIVAPIRSLLQRISPTAIESETVVVGVGDEIDQPQLIEQLVSMGYRREYQVEHRGEVAVRGSIVDVYPSTADAPVRIDLWGDEVDRLTEFAVADQRTTATRSEVTLFGCREVRPSEAIVARARELIAEAPWGREQWERLVEGQLFDGMESWLPFLVDRTTLLPDLVPADGQVMVIDPRRCRDRTEDILAEERDLSVTLAKTWDAGDDLDAALHVPFERLLSECPAPVWHLPAVPDAPDVARVSATGWGQLGVDGGLLAQLRAEIERGSRIVIAADGEGSATRLTDLLVDEGISVERADAGTDLTRPGVRVVVTPLERGVVLTEVGVAVLAEPDLTGRRRSRRPPKRRVATGYFDDLAPGDFVVHEQHGVARYEGMVTRAIGGVERDYLLLQYRGDDRLYVPSDQIDVVRHYTGGDTPSVSKLGGADWQKTKARVRSAISEIAQELVVLYQRRVTTPGHAFGADTPWQRELEDAFPWQETPDQLVAIDAVKADMEEPSPMDRLVCGDVGFGKTEVAIRAAFKAIQDGKQVAVLVPTTLLAQQHLQTFRDRFAGFPVRVEALSRFLTAKEARGVVEGVEAGEVDVVIGTHRLLSEDVGFKDLGLLVVDEEQRFGVKHKEAIKHLRTGVDVLTLTATPIPRTLEMSLTGIRDLTLLNTPPADRQPILTYVGEHEERAIAEAIRRELLREGQVFFVHNRVMDIEHAAARVRELVPEARVAVAHGQMDEGTLEQVVYDFWEGRYDVLVCTTIIESGIDMPTVNTMVVDRAELLGLGQLHQLRGRVGRAGMRAYAYLFWPADRSLTEEAYERLRTIGETTELGSGFKIAMRDLEIRGAGNLLGTGQSGHIAAVGYDLYCQMVTEAVAELKGEAPPEHVEITVDLPVDAHIPADYVAKESLRLEAYRRLAGAETDGEVDDIRQEWVDRYGPVPEGAEALLAVAALRVQARRLGITEISVTKGDGFGGPKFVAVLAPVQLRQSAQIRLDRTVRHARYQESAERLILPVRAAATSAVELHDALVALVPPGKEVVPA